MHKLALQAPYCIFYDKPYVLYMEPEQCRAARALLALKQIDLAQRSGVSLRTIIRFEKGESASTPANLNALRAALESAGVDFIDANGGGAGVRLRER